MSDYAWKIEEDHIGGEDVDLYGPADINDEQRALLDQKEGRVFRMRDDDGILYYVGRIIGGDGFEPLDDYGLPGAGCTHIEYMENGKWEIL